MLSAPETLDRLRQGNQRFVENVRSVDALATRIRASRIRLIDDDGLCVVGAEYSLETGAVDFFDGVPR
jgi:hypothetical protein